MLSVNSFCVRCEADYANPQNEIKGLCYVCVDEIKNIATERGFPIEREPTGHKKTRLIDGTSIFWWRNKWRAQK